MQSILVAELNNGVYLPALGLGSWQLPDDDHTTKHVTKVLELGYRLIDTADKYNNHKAVGKATALFKGCTKKEDRQVCMEGISKFKAVTEEDLVKNLETVPFKINEQRSAFVTTKIWPRDYESERVRAKIEQMSKELQRSPLDLVLMHWPSPIMPFMTEEEAKDPKNPERRLECWRALEELVAEKKIRCIGVANFMPSHLRHVLEDVAARKAKGCPKATVPAVNQMELSPLCQPSTELTKLMEEHKIHATSYSTFGASGGVVVKTPAVIAVAEKIGKPVNQVLLRWALQSGISVIPKTGSEAHAKENMECLYFSLTPEQMETISGLHPPQPVRTCPDPHLCI